MEDFIKGMEEGTQSAPLEIRGEETGREGVQTKPPGKTEEDRALDTFFKVIFHYFYKSDNFP